MDEYEYEEIKYPVDTEHSITSDHGEHEESNKTTSSSMDMNNSEKSNPELKEVRVFAPGYKEWSGHNTILCNGRIFCPQLHWKFVVMISVLLLPSIIHLSTTARILWIDYLNASALIGSTILLMLCLIFLLATNGMDPGIIPRINKFEVPIESYSANKHNQLLLWRSGIYRSFRQTINVDGKVVVNKWCVVCDITRPPRSWHCQICDNCVEVFQFHDEWIGCVGRRNYKYFLLWVITLNIYMIYVAWHSFILLKYGWLSCVNCSSLKAFTKMCRLYPFTVSMIILEVLIFWLPFGLAVFYIYLAATAQTMPERGFAKEVNETKYKYEEAHYEFRWELRQLKYGSPYSRGICCNLWNAIKICSTSSNIHIHHKPPDIQNMNEAIINKKRIHYLKPGLVQGKLDEITALAVSGYIRNIQQSLLFADSNHCCIIPEEIIFICLVYMGIDRAKCNLS